MGVYTLHFAAVANGAVQDTDVTIAAIIAGPTAGIQARLVHVNIGPAGATSLDEDFTVSIQRIEDLSGGGAGTKTAIAVADMARATSRTANGVVSGAHTYTVEPTAYDAQWLWSQGLNGRGGASMTWTERTAPVIEDDQILGFVIQGHAAVPTAHPWSGVMIFEEP